MGGPLRVLWCAGPLVVIGNGVIGWATWLRGLVPRSSRRWPCKLFTGTDCPISDGPAFFYLVQHVVDGPG